MRFFFTDTETTGVGKDDRICEVAWAETDSDLNVLASSVSLINPGRPISAGAGAVNGLTDAMVADAPTIEQYMAGEGAPLAGEDVLMIAHNASFDFKYLQPHMAESAQTLCTLKCARQIYPDSDNHKQATLAYMLGITVDRAKAHSADGDIEVLIEMTRCMLRDAGCSIEELLHIQNIPVVITKMPFGKHQGLLLSDIPKSYVDWLLNKCTNLKPDLRAALLAL